MANNEATGLGTRKVMLVKFRDSFGSKGPEGPTRETAINHDRGNRPGESLKAQGAPFMGEAVYRSEASESNKPPATTTRAVRRRATSDPDLSVFQDRLRMGKVKLCISCGGVMRKSSRMLLSWVAGLTVTLLGIVLMTAYGFLTNFYQPPWYIKFVLPAGYYVGSILIAVGILFFFIREKIWYCPNCRDMQKR